MVTTYLPVSAHQRLTLLADLRKKQTDNALTPVQSAVADMVFSKEQLAKMRVQALKEMVASGYTTQEIRMVFADPDSPYSVLIEELEPKNVIGTLTEAINAIRKEQKQDQTAAAINEYVQGNRRLRDATYATLADSGAAHHKSLLDFINQRNQDIADALGIRVVRAGRASTKKGTGTGPEAPDAENENDEKQSSEIDWGEEFKPANENPE